MLSTDVMNLKRSDEPWPLSFSFARALRVPALKAWGCNPANVPAAQGALYHRARFNSAAREGRYTSEVEREGRV
jgi:fructose-bisphosphate aldolase class I